MNGPSGRICSRERVRKKVKLISVRIICSCHFNQAINYSAIPPSNYVFIKCIVAITKSNLVKIIILIYSSRGE